MPFDYKELFKGSKWLEDLDFLVAGSMCRLFHLQDPLQELFLAILFSFERRGFYFFHIENLNHSELGCVVTEEAFKKLYPIYLNESPAFFSAFSQKMGTNYQLPVIEIDRHYSFQKTYFVTTEWTRSLRAFLNQQTPLQIDNEHDELVSLTDEQKKAVQGFWNKDFVVLTGGPGRGKTYTAAVMVKSYLKRFPKATLVIAAPTAKASENLLSKIKHFSDTATIEAKTIHSLLKMTPSGSFSDSDDKIMADLLIVDECSMIDFKLFHLLLAQLFPKTKILFLGDPNQLPPIDGPSPFSLLVELENWDKNLSVYQLTKPLRTESKPILDLLDAILNEDEKAFMNCVNNSPSIQFLEDSFLFQKLEQWAPLLAQKTGKMIDYERLYDKKILCSHNVGLLGSDQINKKCLDLCYSQFQNQTFFVPVIIQENDSRLKISNGEMGFLSVNTAQPKIYLKDKEPLHLSLAPRWDYAFAISIHKSQGSEFSEVILTLQDFPGVSKELLYTGCSRAKKQLFCFGNFQLYNKAMKKTAVKNVIWKKVVKEKIETQHLVIN